MTSSMYSLFVFFMLSVSAAGGLALLPCHGKTTTQQLAIDSGSEKRPGTAMLTSGVNNDDQQEQPQSRSTPCSDIPEIVDENQLLVATAKSRDSAAGSTVVSGTPEGEKPVRPIDHQISNKDDKTGDIVRSGESSMSGQSRQRRSAISAAEAAEGGALLAWDKRPRYYRENDGGASTRDWRTNMMRVWGKRANGINPRRQKGPNRGGYTAG